MAIKVKPIVGEKRTRLLKQKLESDGVVPPVSEKGRYIFLQANVDRLDGETQDGRTLSKVEAVSLVVANAEAKKFRISIGNLNKECRDALLLMLEDIDSGAASKKLIFNVKSVNKSEVVIKGETVGDRYELVSELSMIKEKKEVKEVAEAEEVEADPFS